ncbi:hypothetical protein THAOC_22039, partial [Thalassiosira oceanica]
VANSSVHGGDVAEADVVDGDPPGADGGADVLARKLERFNDFVSSLGVK